MTERHYDIHKAAAVIIENRQVLLTRSHDKTVFVPPGGKLEDGEDEKDALIRELGEELGITAERDDLEPVGTFYAEAAGGSGKALRMGVYLVRKYVGTPRPHGEVAELASVSSEIPDGMEVGSIMLHDVIPRLVADDLID